MITEMGFKTTPLIQSAYMTIYLNVKDYKTMHIYTKYKKNAGSLDF